MNMFADSKTEGEHNNRSQFFTFVFMRILVIEDESTLN